MIESEADKYPRQGDASRFWVPKLHTSGSRTRFCIRAVLALRLTLLPQMITRLLDWLEVGDNYVIVLRKA